MVGFEAELTLQFLPRRGNTKGLHTDDATLVADIALSPQRRCSLDSETQFHTGRQHIFVIRCRLALSQDGIETARERIPRNVSTS